MPLTSDFLIGGLDGRGQRPDSDEFLTSHNGFCFCGVYKTSHLRIENPTITSTAGELQL
jgi:hypothetical protein